MQSCLDIRTFVRMSTSILLTENQQRVLDCIERHFAQHGCAPTLREIAETLGFARHSSAQDYVEALVRKGALERLPRHRGLRLAARGGRPRAASAYTLPLIGRVAAGSPILAQENIERQIGIDASLFHPAADYLLRVMGSSMQDAGILDGDLIAVHRTAEAAQGRPRLHRAASWSRAWTMRLRSSVWIRAMAACACYPKIPILPRSKLTRVVMSLRSKACMSA